MRHAGFDLAASARQEMIHEGFNPDFPPGTSEQLEAIGNRNSGPAPSGLKDLRQLCWSSIDNDTSRDLDQIEVAERVEAGIRVLVGIADVDAEVAMGRRSISMPQARPRPYTPRYGPFRCCRKSSLPI